MDLKVRLSKPEDLEAILELQASSLRNLSSSYNSSQIESLVRSQASARLAEEIGFVVEYEGEIVGFASLLADSPQIGGVYVHPDFIRRGIGTKLLKALETAAIDRGHETIYVVASITTESFYQASGYQSVRPSGFYSETTIWIPCVNLKKQLIHVQVSKIVYKRFLSLISDLRQVSFFMLLVSLTTLMFVLLPLIISLIDILFR